MSNFPNRAGLAAIETLGFSIIHFKLDIHTFEVNPGAD